ncbi:phosphoadenosine phosphosulfate reductase [Streptomyces griseocarneus]|nr:phosphoadenosine phosphosulfate reductase [Streptomyces griseocarneus]
MAKRGLGMDVLTAARQRITRVFNDFPVVYVSFSGGKDSGVLLELAAAEARARGRRLGVLIVDLEAQYQLTEDYLRQMLKRHEDVIDLYWVALPMNLRNAVSQFQPQWMCWEPGLEESWVRTRPPEAIGDESFFDFYERGMEFEDFVPKFGDWYSRRNGGRMTACLVGIRSQESLNRYRTIASTRKQRHDGLAWTTMITAKSFNAYPIYDWRTEDIWTFYSRERVPHNQVYDRMHQAGLTLHQMRLCQPYGDDQKRGLWLYQLIEPHTWGMVAARVQGAEFGARTAREIGNVSGRIKVTKPDGITWEQFAQNLLASMPAPAAEHFRTKIAVFIRWHQKNNGFVDGVIPDDGPMDKINPSWKRIVKMLLSYDYWCKEFAMAPPKSKNSYEAYKKRMRIKREEWGLRGTV